MENLTLLKPRLLRTFASLCLVGLTTGCSESSDSGLLSAQQESKMVQDMVVVTVPERYQAQQPTLDELKQMSVEERRERSLARRAADEKIRAAIASEGDWTSADAEIQTIVDGSPDVPRYELEQVASTLMLNRRLLRLSTVDQNAADAILRHTARLIVNESTSTALIANALETVPEGHRTSDVQALAVQAIDLATAKMQTATDCNSCSVKEMVATLEANPHSGLAGLSAESIGRLQEVAGN